MESDETLYLYRGYDDGTLYRWLGLSIWAMIEDMGYDETLYLYRGHDDGTLYRGLGSSIWAMIKDMGYA